MRSISRRLFFVLGVGGLAAGPLRAQTTSQSSPRCEAEKRLGPWRVGRRLGNIDNFGIRDFYDRVQFDPEEGTELPRGADIIESLRFEFRQEVEVVVGGRVEVKLQDKGNLERKNRTVQVGLMSFEVGSTTLSPAESIAEHDIYFGKDEGEGVYWSSTTKFALPRELAAEVFKALNSGASLSLGLLVPNDGDVEVSVRRISLDLSPLRDFHAVIGQIEDDLIADLDAEDCVVPEPSGGGCYLTTICCQIIGLPDDCFELTVLRAFRDRFMAARAKGQADLSEYRRLGPIMADAIARSPRRRAIARMAYLRFILPSIIMILIRRPRWAWAHYRRGVAYLASQPEIAAALTSSEVRA